MQRHQIEDMLDQLIRAAKCAEAGEWKGVSNEEQTRRDQLLDTRQLLVADAIEAVVGVRDELAIACRRIMDDVPAGMDVSYGTLRTVREALAKVKGDQ